MANEEKVMDVMEKLRVADKHAVAEVMASLGIWKAGTSAVNNSYKALVALVDLGKLEKLNGSFRVKGCRSEYGEHSQLLTRTQVDILKVYPDTLMHREHLVKDVGLRADALALLTKGGKGLCLWIEVCNHEHPDYFEKKKNALRSWDALPYLSKIFQYHIPAFHLVKDSELPQVMEDMQEERHG